MCWEVRQEQKSLPIAVVYCECVNSVICAGVVPVGTSRLLAPGLAAVRFREFVRPATGGATRFSDSFGEAGFGLFQYTKMILLIRR